MSQSEDCLKWNAALSLYKLVLEVTRMEPTNLLTSVCRWESSGQQGRVLLVQHLLKTLDFKDPGGS